MVILFQSLRQPKTHWNINVLQHSPSANQIKTHNGCTFDSVGNEIGCMLWVICYWSRMSPFIENYDGAL